jgi:hypothetical protein
MSSILDHPEWITLRWCLFPEYVARDPRPDFLPRFRIEVWPALPDVLVQHLLTLRSPCVACGAVMTPIRKRLRGGLYFAATCEDALHGSCSKGAAAREEYLRIHDALTRLGPEPAAPPMRTQQSLFEML